MLTLCWLPFVALLAPAGITHPRPSVVLVPPVADTGTVADTAVLLTPSVLASYIEVEKALEVYWGEHSKQAQAARTTHVHIYSVSSGPRSNKPVIDYAFWAQQDTALAALFMKSHVDPSQLGPTEVTVDRSIGEALQYHPVDLKTVAGKNVATVRAHHQELIEEWNRMQEIENINKKLRSMFGGGTYPVHVGRIRFDSNP